MDYLNFYKKIFLIRSFENKLDELFKKGLVNGTAHFCIGQEYIPVIISQYLSEKDDVTSTHRGHGHAIAKGLDIKKLFAEIMGKNYGYNNGCGGSQHIVSKDHNFYANGITGGMVPIAVGMGFNHKYTSSGNISVAFLGDGGFNEGYVQEALNLAGTFKLPVLFVCENNHYAMSTHINKAHSSEIVNKAKSYGINTALIEDNDFMHLNEISKKFIDSMRKIPEPCFIEVRTYRHRGHSKNDKNLYRPKQEEEFWFEKDVLDMIKNKINDTEKIKIIEQGIEKLIECSVDEVIKMPQPDPKNIIKD